MLTSKDQKFLEYFDRISIRGIFLFALLLILVFAALFYVITINSPQNGLVSEYQLGIVSYLAFSFSLFFSANYNGIVSIGASTYVSLIETIIGYLFLGIFISKIVSYKQDKILKSIYSITFHNKFHEFRVDLQKLRHEIRKKSNEIINEKDQSSQDTLLNTYFKKEGGEDYPRRISISIRAIHFFIKTEIEKEPSLIREINSYEFEELLNSICLSLDSIKTSIDKFKEKKVNWRSKYLIRKIHYVLERTEGICKITEENYQSKVVSDKISEIKVIKKVIIESIEQNN